MSRLNYKAHRKNGVHCIQTECAYFNINVEHNCTGFQNRGSIIEVCEGYCPENTNTKRNKKFILAPQEKLDWYKKLKTEAKNENQKTKT